MANENKNISVRQSTQQFELAAGNWFKANLKKMTTLAGDPTTAKQMMVALLESVRKTPKLLECTQESLFTCVIQSAALNLFPGPMAESAYVPFKGVATFMPTAVGLTKLAYNSGHVKGISAAVVYAADEFDYEQGSNPFVKHKSYLGPRDKRGERVCCYCSIETLKGRIVTVLTMDFIKGIKDRSPGGKYPDSPWSNGNPDDFDAMCRKTVIKQGLKLIPKSPKMVAALESDDDFEAGTGGTFDVTAFNNIGNGNDEPPAAAQPAQPQSEQEGQQNTEAAGQAHEPGTGKSQRPSSNTA